MGALHGQVVLGPVVAGLNDHEALRHLRSTCALHQRDGGSYLCAQDVVAVRLLERASLAKAMPASSSHGEEALREDEHPRTASNGAPAAAKRCATATEEVRGQGCETSTGDQG